MCVEFPTFSIVNGASSVHPERFQLRSSSVRHFLWKAGTIRKTGDPSLPKLEHVAETSRNAPQFEDTAKNAIALNEDPSAAQKDATQAIHAAIPEAETQRTVVVR